MVIEAARLAFLNPTNLDEYYNIGFGEEATGGAAGIDISVTVLSTVPTIVGSWGWALQQIANTPFATGNIYVKVLVSGNLTQTSVASINRPNVTIDALGQFFCLQGRGISFGSNANNIVLLNLQGDAISSGDWISLEAGTTPFMLAHMESAPFGGQIVDGHIDITEARPEGQYGTVCWFRSNPHTNNELVMILGDRVTDQEVEVQFLTTHHNYYAGTRQRHPLVMGNVHSVNNYIRWGTLEGICGHHTTENAPLFGSTKPCEIWSENDTFDAAVASGEQGSGVDYHDTRSRGKITGARSLNGVTQLRQQNSTLVSDFHAMYITPFTPHTASATHDTFVQRRAGARMRVTMSGTLNGKTSDALVGETVVLQFSANDPLPAAGSAFDAVRQSIIDGFKIVGDATFDPGDLFTSVSNIVRTSSTVVTCTVSGNLALEDDSQLYWEEDPTGTWLCAWNPQTIIASGGEPEPPEDPDSDITIVNLTFDATTTDATSYETASVTIDPDKYYLMTVSNSRVPINEVPTATGWTQLATIVNTVDNRQLTLFGADGSALSTGTVTIDFNGETQTGCAWSIEEVANVDETTPVIAGNTTSDEFTGLSALLTMGAFTSPRNSVYSGWMHEDDTEGVPGDGFTLLATDFFAPQHNGILTQWKAGEDATVDVTWPQGSFTPGGSQSTLGIAIELNEAPSGTPLVPTITAPTEDEVLEAFAFDVEWTNS